MKHQTVRRLRRFFSEATLSQVGDIIRLQPSETHHLKNILRLKPGDRCLMVDSSGREAEAVVSEFLSNQEAALRIQKIFSELGEARPNLRVFAAIPQKGKMEFMIEKAQELGVDEWIPLETERTVVKMSDANKQKVSGRWNKIAREAAKQSGAARLVRIRLPVSFREAIKKRTDGQTTAVFHPRNADQSFQDWIRDLDASKETNLFFGPEGGFSDKEIAFARENGAAIIHLGRMILKVDTAVLAVVSSLRFKLP